MVINFCALIREEFFHLKFTVLAYLDPLNQLHVFKVRKAVSSDAHQFRRCQAARNKFLHFLLVLDGKVDFE